MAADVLLVGFGRHADAALHRCVIDLQAGDPLRPVTVAVPSAYARVLLRRSWPGGLCNVRFEPLNRIAELLGAPFLAGPGRAPLVPAVLRETVRATLAGAGGTLRRLDPHGTVAAGTNPAGLDALTEVVGELWSVPPPALRAALGGDAGHPTHDALVALHAEVRERLADRYDDEEQLRAAAEHARRAGVPPDLGPLVAHLPDRLTPGAVALLEAWATGPGVTVILGVTGDASLDAPVRGRAAEIAGRLGTRVTDLAAGIPDPPPPLVRLGPDPDTEVRMVVADVLAAVSAGVPLWRIAVAYASADPYARLLAARFREAGVPVAGPSPHRLAERAAGRFVLRALAAADPAAPLARAAVVACLDGVPVRVGDVVLAATRVEQVSRRAGVVGGLEGPTGWREALVRARAAHPSGAPATADDAGTSDAGSRDVDLLDALATFVDGLAAIDGATERAWDEWAGHLRALLDTHVRLPATAPLPEHAAHEEVRAALDRLASLPGTRVPHPVVTDALARLLQRSEGRLGAVEQGVLLAPLTALWATTWDRVFVVGLAEGRFPARRTPDPFLDVTIRDRLGLGGTRTERVLDARRRLAATCASADACTCSSARADPASGTALLPAPALVDLARAAGTAGNATELVTVAATRHPSFPAWLEGTPEPLSPTDWELTELARTHRAGGPPLHHRLVTEIDALAGARACLTARAAHRLTAYDGIVGPLPGLLGSRPLHPSQLQAWGECPFRYFLDGVCGLRRTEAPEDAVEIDPRTRGTAVHEILQRFFEHHRPDPALGWTDADHAALVAVADAVLDAREAAGAVGYPRWWAVTRAETIAEVRAALARDLQLRRERNERPRWFEVVFGDGEDAAWPTLELTLAGVPPPVRFAGRIDRIDEADDGTTVTVYDYKTGRPPSRRATDDPLDDPLGLQLAVYGLAARARWPGRKVRAAYWYTGARPGHELVEVPLDEHGADVDRLVTRVALGIMEGFFPLRPGAETDWPVPGTCEQCRSCDFGRVCPADRATLAARKAGDPAWQAHPWAAPPVAAETGDPG